MVLLHGPLGPPPRAVSQPPVLLVCRIRMPDGWRKGQWPGQSSNCVYGMNDPYMPLERERQLTRQALRVIAECRFPVHVITKSDLVLRDLDLLKEISRVYAAVSFTVTTADDVLSKKIEPGAPPSSRRFEALRVLAANGIVAGVTMMPILPFIEDTEENIAAIVEQAHAAGARYVLPAFGMTMRDRQRAHYYDKLDQLFPGLRDRYQQRYAERYECSVPNAKRLDKLFRGLCEHYGLLTRMPFYSPDSTSQLALL
jgi:DNA repair photolyase